MPNILNWKLYYLKLDFFSNTVILPTILHKNCLRVDWYGPQTVGMSDSLLDSFTFLKCNIDFLKKVVLQIFKNL